MYFCVCRIEEDRLRAEALANSMDSGDSDQFWFEMRKQSIKSNVLSSTVEHARTDMNSLYVARSLLGDLKLRSK
jgi:hypothetical protein